MKTLLFLAASALAIAAAGCAPNGKPDLRTALDCPASQGDLTRTGKAADGKTCTYRSSGGAEVSLQLVAVTGDAASTLQGIENTIAPPQSRAAGESGAESAEAAKDSAETAKDAAEAAKDAAETAKESAKDAADAVREASADAGRAAGVVNGGKDEWSTGARDAKAKVDIQIDKQGHKIVSSDGDTARIDLPGIHIAARDDDKDGGGAADVQIGGIRINANEDGAKIHNLREVRLRGEALMREKRGIRATFISTNKAEPGGYRFVGYEASGPKTGPLTVAIVKAKSEINHDDDMARDVRRLVRRNGGA